MEIRCFKCEKAYKPGLHNTKIYGPYIRTECPFCNYVYHDKFLNFIEEQIGGERKMLITAVKMQQLAKFVELNSSDYYKKKKRRKRGK
jgi:hypothetical protein